MGGSNSAAGRRALGPTHLRLVQATTTDGNPTMLHDDATAGNESTVAPSPLGSVQHRVHTGPTGSRDYDLYVPAGLTAPAPLLVMLHGGTQNAADFALGTGMNRLADQNGFVVAYPEQSRSANPAGYWNWFQPDDQRRDSGEPAIIAGIVTEIAAAHAIDPARIFVAGLSAGGAMAEVMAATYPEVFAKVGVHSGLPYRSAADVGSAFGVMSSGHFTAAASPTPVLVVHGDHDSTVAVGNATGVLQCRLLAYPQASTGEVTRSSEGGRAFIRTRHRIGGRTVAESFIVTGGGHAWFGGDPKGSYTDPSGPDASAELVRFFLED
ncbi:MAG: PHB depolymerase family esterase [Nakamurella sp.]